MWIYVKPIWIFSIITPVFSVTWSSEIILIYWFAAQETFLIIINVKNNCAASYFCGNCDAFYFQDLHMNRKFKRTSFIWNRIIFCNIINVFTVTFDQIIAVLANFFNAYSKLG